MTTDLTTSPRSKYLALLAADEPRVYAAFEATRAERDALDDDEVDDVMMNVDIGQCVSTVLGAIPGIQAHRDELAAMPGMPIEQVDALETYALALQCAHALYLASTAPPEPLGELISEGAQLRDRFFTLAAGLAQWGLLPAERLPALRSGNSHRNVGEDLIAIGSLFRSRWAQIAGKAPVTTDDVDEALQRGEQIMALVGLRDRAAGRITDAARDRRKAFVLVDRAFSHARRGLTYARWFEGDADEIAPALRGLRNTRKDRDKETDEAPAPPAPPAPASPTGGPDAPPAEPTPANPNEPRVPRKNPFDR